MTNWHLGSDSGSLGRGLRPLAGGLNLGPGNSDWLETEAKPERLPHCTVTQAAQALRPTLSFQ